MVGADWPMKALSMHIQKPFRIIKGNNSHRIGLALIFFIVNIRHVNMNMLARFDEIPLIALQDIKETKCYRLPDRQTYVKAVLTKRSVLIWFQTILHSDGFPERIF